MRDAAIEGQIRDLEARRCNALTTGDVSTLETLVAEDLVHIHGDGHIDGKAAYLSGVENKYTFHRIERGDLDIRTYGDTVVVVGTLDQTISVNGVDRRHDISAMTTQTWLRSEDGWRQTTCHNAFLKMA